MAETYGFWDSTEGDTRTYSADSFNNILQMLFTDGICGDSTSLRASGSGLSVSVSAGGAIIEGHWYKNSAAKSLSFTPPTSGVRYDRIVLRHNISNKRIGLVYRKGTGSSPPEPVNNGTYHDIPICKLLVSSSQIISITDERNFISLRGGS